MNLDQLEPATAKFIQTLLDLKRDPIYKMSIPTARKALENLQNHPENPPPIDCQDHVIESGDKKITISLYRPKNNTERLPVVLYFHGGGWILGSKITHDRLMRDISTQANVGVVFVHYTSSPEAKYPVPIEQAYAALEYVAQHGNQLNLDTTKIAVAGDSVGGNMAAVIALLAKERKGPTITKQILCYPVTNANFDTESYRKFADGPWLLKGSMEWFWDAYAPDVAQRKHYALSPLNASIEQLKGLPRTLLITVENDVLRDEGEAYAHRLIQAGVDVTSVRFLGTIHDFIMINYLSKTPAAKAALKLIIDYLRN